LGLFAKVDGVWGEIARCAASQIKGRFIKWIGIVCESGWGLGEIARCAPVNILEKNRAYKLDEFF